MPVPVNAHNLVLNVTFTYIYISFAVEEIRKAVYKPEHEAKIVIKIVLKVSLVIL